MAEVWPGSDRRDGQQNKWVEMSSSGPWYGPAVKANCILGCRAVRSGRLRWQDVAAQIETRLRSELKNDAKAPVSKSANAWERDEPGYPEWALRHRLITKADLVPGVSDFVRDSSPVEMQQAETSPLRDFLVTASVAWLGYEVLKRLFSRRGEPSRDASSPAAQEPQWIGPYGMAKPAPRRRGPVI